MSFRERSEALEEKLLSPYASRSALSRGRPRAEEPCPLRTAYQRDRDRVLHSKAFRRLKGKTQVFFAPAGDHYRTRLTHTLEVAQIARTIARGLRLNEDLTEAAALAHDLGHAPFGHAGEDALNEAVPCGFQHDAQSLRIVDRLENDGRGLNLTYETRAGIQCHSKGAGAILDPMKARQNTLEGSVIRIADAIAYLNHDIEDAARANALRPEELPAESIAVLGSDRSARIGRMTEAVVAWSEGRAEVGMEPTVLEATEALKAFMYQNVYPSRSDSESVKARGVVQALAEHYMGRPEELPPLYRRVAEEEGNARAAADYIAGMTDRFALDAHGALFRPKVWSYL